MYTRLPAMVLLPQFSGKFAQNKGSKDANQHRTLQGVKLPAAKLETFALDVPLAAWADQGCWF